MKFLYLPVLMLFLFVSCDVFAKQTVFSPSQVSKPKTKIIKVQPSSKAVKKQKETLRCLRGLPSRAAQQYIQSYVDQIAKKNSQEKAAKVYCALYEGFAYRHTLEVPQEYKNQLPPGAPTRREFVSPVEECFAKNAKSFCEGQNARWRRDPNDKKELEEVLLEFSWIRGTSQSPFLDTEDYLKGIGFLIDVLDQRLFARQKYLWIKNKK